jgi:ATPase family associated with various cellular activities (AAA)
MDWRPETDAEQNRAQPGQRRRGTFGRRDLVIPGRRREAKSSIYNTREPAQALANMESMTVEAVFILKDFHRHMDDPVVVRRLRDVGQKFSANRRTVIITAPVLTVPAELSTLVEYFDLPLPDRERLREIVHQTFTRLSKTYTLKLQLDAAGVDAMAANLRGLTEEESERAVSQALVTRYALCLETVTDVIEAKKQLLRHSGMLEFIEASDSMASVGGLENLKHWLVQRRGAWEDAAREFGLEPPHGVIILGVQGCGKSLCARAVAGEWQLPLVKFDTSAVYDKFIGETEKRIRKVFQVAEGVACCGSTNSKRCLPAAGRIRLRLMRESRRGCWRHFFRGCKTEKPRSLWLPRAIT